MMDVRLTLECIVTNNGSESAQTGRDKSSGRCWRLKTQLFFFSPDSEERNQTAQSYLERNRVKHIQQLRKSH